MKPVLCSKCYGPLPLDPLASGEIVCPGCRAELRVALFPAIHRDIAVGPAAEQSILDGESTCFFHADKKAAAVCDDCGRFLCALCDVAIGGRHLCPRCIETGRARKTLTTFETYRTSYPSLALTIALLPLLAWPVTLLTGPLTVFFVCYGWSKPPSLTGQKRRFALLIALLVGLAQCLGWILLGANFYEGIVRG